MAFGRKRETSLKWYRIQVRARRLFNKLPLRDSQKIYILTLLIGVLSGLAVVVFDLLLDFLQRHIIYTAAQVPGITRFPLVIIIPGLGAFVATLILYVLSPSGLGSGVSAVKRATHIDRGRIPVNVVWGKMLSVALNIGSGAALGPEGPAVQIAAAIASFLGRLFTVSRRTLQALVPVGAAAGLAAAFNTPISAVTFTLEDILGNATERPLGSIVVASVIAAVIRRSIIGEHPLFDVPPYRLGSAAELIFYAVLGVCIGAASAGFKDGVMRVRAFCKSQKKIPDYVMPAFGGLIVGTIGLLALTGTGSPSVLGMGYPELVSGLRGNLIFKVFLILGIAKLFATMMSAGTGSPGGLFAPALYIGGMLGGAIGVIVQHILPSSHAGAFALVGMGAAFAGIIRAPVTSIIIIFEMTNNYSIILPLMIANILSYAIATRLSPEPIYDALLLQDGVHLPHGEPHVLRRIPVYSAMTTDVVTVNARMKVADAFIAVQKLPVHHHAYPVVDGDSQLAGLCTFNDLKRAMAEGDQDQTLGQAISSDLTTVFPDQSLEDVMYELGRHGYSQLPVVSRQDSRHLLGIITMGDVAQALAKIKTVPQATIESADH